MATSRTCCLAQRVVTCSLSIGGCFAAAEAVELLAKVILSHMLPACMMGPIGGMLVGLCTSLGRSEPPSLPIAVPGTQDLASVQDGCGLRNPRPHALKLIGLGAVTACAVTFKCETAVLLPED